MKEPAARIWFIGHFHKTPLFAKPVDDHFRGPPFSSIESRESIFAIEYMRVPGISFTVQEGPRLLPPDKPTPRTHI